VNDLIRSIIAYAFIIGVIIGGFWFYKTSTKATVDSADSYMNIEHFKPGSSYAVDNSITSVKDLVQGDVVAYFLPGEPDVHKIGRVVAIEGQLVEANPTFVKVDRKTVTIFKSDARELIIPEIRIPKNCVWVMADRTTLAKDSMHIGPVPFFNIMGKVKY